MKVQGTIEVKYESTNNPIQAKQWIDGLPDLFAADFETAIKYSPEEVQEAKEKMVDDSIPKRQRIEYQAIAKSSALGHPSHCTITHCSIAYSKKDAYVFIIDSQEMADVVLDFLIETEKVQIWHNYGYDGRFLCYYAGSNAKNIEDTSILAKTLVNHVEVMKASVGLKQLMGEFYGDWGISSDNFDVSQQYEEHVLKYAAIDAASTYHLWEYLQQWIKDVNNNT